MSSAIGGKLKLKGGAPLGSQGKVSKKKKKRRASGEEPQGSELVEAAASEAKETPEGVYLDPAAAADRRTAAEKKYDEYLLKRETEKIKKMAAKSHREKVNEFNEYLTKLSEHHDIPKVGPG